MIGRILVAAISVFIGACASSGPEAPVPAVTTSSASVDAVASDNPSAPPAGDLQDLATPQTASASPASDPDEIICRRERETGSNFTTRICRTRAEIEAREAQDQEILRGMGKIRTGSECALTGDC
jgi:hypothetical protein